MDSALIHRARLVERGEGERNELGERPEGETALGPWFAARLMESGGPADRRRRRQDQSTDARVARGFELLAAPTDVDGDAVVLFAGAVVETDCEILGSPTLELSGDPEKLTNGVDHIGWNANAVQARDAA